MASDQAQKRRYQKTARQLQQTSSRVGALRLDDVSPKHAKDIEDMRREMESWASRLQSWAEDIENQQEEEQ